MLAKAGDEIISVTIEGKVNEPFGPLVKDWMITSTSGKTIRLNFLCEKLNICPGQVQHLRYQLLHRTVSAILEMERFGTTSCAMFVHSFSLSNMWLDDFSTFLNVLGLNGNVGTAINYRLATGKTLYLGWAKGDQKYTKF